MFIQPCFIRKNTSELKKKLEELGYKYLNVGTGLPHLCTDNDILTDKGFGIFRECNMGNLTLLHESKIDCGTNEDLFLAIAALRNDSDYMQWFVTEANQSWFNMGIYSTKGSFELCLVHDRYMGQNKEFCNTVVPAHKATVEELIKHFK